MTDLVDRTLAIWRRGRHVWGASDCLLAVGDYLASAGRPDVSSRFRGTYSTEAGALRYLAFYGGPAGMIDLTGLPRTRDPLRGDVAVLDVGDGGVGALCVGDRFALRLERGVIEIDRRFVRQLAAWRV